MGVRITEPEGKDILEGWGTYEKGGFIFNFFISFGSKKVINSRDIYFRLFDFFDFFAFFDFLRDRSFLRARAPPDIFSLVKFWDSGSNEPLFSVASESSSIDNSGTISKKEQLSEPYALPALTEYMILPLGRGISLISVISEGPLHS